jgi:serine/threonine protein kinase
MNTTTSQHPFNTSSMKYANVSLALPYTLTSSTSTFRLTKEIGRGSFATVYLCNDEYGQSWAVKTFNKSTLSAKQLASIRFESRIMSLVSDHPNVAKLHCAIESPQHFFLIMELCEMDLFEAITRQKGGFSHENAAAIIVQVIDSLKHIHARGVYHRDIKPENLLISSDFKVKLADFGLCTTTRFSKDYGCGSVRYMSPECMNSEKSRDLYDAEANDVWSLGILLVNLLFGKNPWHEARLSDPIYARYVLEDASILARQFNLSREFSQILDAIFHPDPTDRISLVHLRARIISVGSFTLAARPRGNRASAVTTVKEPLMIDTSRQKQRTRSEYMTPAPDSAFESVSPMSPIQRVKSRVKRTLSKMFG